MMKYFNTTGAIQPDIHYCIPPLERINTKEVLELIAARKSFILHAPRQTGKTSCLLALADLLNQSGEYRAVYANVEAAQAAREKIETGMRTVLGEIASQAQLMLRDDLPWNRMTALLDQSGGGQALNRLLREWSQAAPLPLVVMFDEVDALIGDMLISLLRQLRGGYQNRPQAFPQSVILCGVRDVRDYRIHSAAAREIITGGSAFNIKAESLRLGNFPPEDVERLYRQHTTATGQIFEDDIFPLVWEWTAGQPWLVNALAHQATWNIQDMRDRAKPVTIEVMRQAREELIQRRDTHLDQLNDKLSEERVRRVIEPMLTGSDLASDTSMENEVRYVMDLGLIRQGAGGLEISNEIYREIIPRELTAIAQLNLESTQQTAWYVQPDGRLDMNKLLAAFQQYFRENSEHWGERFAYKEAGPQLLLQSFLRRIVNGGGRIEREYALGRGRTDLLLRWSWPGGAQRIVLELKILRKALETTIKEGLVQTLEYGERCHADEMHFVVFDRSKKAWSRKIFHRARKLKGAAIQVWGM
jgi:AAA-like domain